MRALLTLWTAIGAFFITGALLSGSDMTSEDKLFLQIIVAVVIIVINLFIWALTSRPHRADVPPEERLPRIEEPAPPSKPRPPAQPLEVIRLEFYIRGKEETRLGTEVHPDDLAIRPYVEFELNHEASLGKQATMIFRIAHPRRRTRYDWEWQVPFTFAAGLNKVWPPQEEYPIAGEDREQGTWTLEVSLADGAGLESPWLQETFKIRPEYQAVEVNVRADAEITGADQEVAEAAHTGSSVRDLLDRL